MLRRLLTLSTHKIYQLPVLVLMPHSRCNCRCVMCDIWKANQNKTEISTEELAKHIETFRRLGVRRVALSGGEALMHTNLWKFCDQLKSIGIKISLLSTGITLKANASDVIKHVDDVIVSLDGSPPLHNEIRNLPSAFEKLSEGVRAIKELNPSFRITGRCVLQKLNYRALPDIIATAQSLGLDQISFLAADVSSTAFNRQDLWTDDKIVQVQLSDDDVIEFEKIVVKTFQQLDDLYRSKFITESPEKMLDLVRYYKAMNGHADFPAVRCNAPWVSAVIESDGEVRPCFFHKSYGNISSGSFEEILNSKESISFRKNLDVKSDSICKRCVCSLHLGITQ